VSAIESDPECLFCRIVAGQLPVELLHEDTEIIAFRDVNPQAPFHCLVIPRTHIATINDIQPAQAALTGRLLLVAAQLAAAHGCAEDGFRVAMNCNRQAGQSVYHIHLHVLAGRQMTWPPG
jgi:histidine triad (HIT) family protein